MANRYPLSPRIRTLKEIRAMIKPYPVSEPAPPQKKYEPRHHEADTGDAVELLFRPSCNARQHRRGPNAAHRMVQGLPPSGRA
jgi:hypothetical protein